MNVRLCCLLILLLLPVSAWAQVTITGHVTALNGGAPLQGVYVDLRTTTGQRPAEHREAWTDAQGRYVLENVSPGSWRLRAVYYDQTLSYSLLTAPLEITKDRLTLHVELPTQLEERLQQQIYPAYHTALKNLTTITGFLDEGQVRNDRGFALPGSQTTLHTSGTLSGLITRGGDPLPGVRVILQSASRETQTDAAGRFEFRNLTPGRFRLRIIHQRDTLDTAPLDIEAGPNVFDLDLSQH